MLSKYCPNGSVPFGSLTPVLAMMASTAAKHGTMYLYVHFGSFAEIFDCMICPSLFPALAATKQASMMKTRNMEKSAALKLFSRYSKWKSLPYSVMTIVLVVSVFFGMGANN